MALYLGPRPPGDAAAMRALARVLFHAADNMQSHASGARHPDLGFSAPAAGRIEARVRDWLVQVDRDAECLRGIGRRLDHEAGGVELAQRRHDIAVARERLAQKPR